MTQEQKIIIKIQANTDKAVREISQLNSQVKKLQTTSKKTSRSMNGLASSFKVATLATAGLFTAIQGARAVGDLIKQFAELENGLIGVAKTTGLTGESLESLDEGIVKLSQELSGIGLKELYEVAETAGQLGIQGEKDILTFSEAIAKISVATELTADQASKDFAILANILKEPISNTEKLGSVINELSNTSEASATDVLNFTRRIASSGKVFGLSSAEILGYGATLKAIGSTAEAGGSAFNRTVDLMTSNMEGFAKVANVSYKEFKDLVLNNPVKAMDVFLESFNKLDKVQKGQAFKELKINSVEAKKTIILLSSNLDKLRTNLATAGDEYERNTSLIKEYNTASGRMEAGLIDIGTEVDILKKRLGDELKDEIDALTKSTIEFLKSIDKADIKKFADALNTVVDRLMGLWELLVKINDYAMPDWLAGKENAGLLDTWATKWIDAFDFIGSLLESEEKLSDKWSDAKDEVHKTADAVDNLASEANTAEKNAEDLRKTLANIDDVKIKVDIDSDPATKEATESSSKISDSYKETRARIAKIKREIKSIGDTKQKVEVEVVSNASEVKEEIARVSRETYESKVYITADEEEFDRVVKENTENTKYDTVILDIDGNSELYGAVLQKVDKETNQVVAEIAIDGNDKKARAKLKELQHPITTTHTIKPDTVAVDSAIRRIKKPTFSVHTIRQRVIKAKAEGGYIDHLADGGFPRRRGKIAGHDLTGRDDVRAMLTQGEFVHNVRAVDYYGKDFMEALNRRLIPKGVLGLASGGLVTPTATSGTNRGSTEKKMVNLNLKINGNNFSLISDEAVATALADYLARSEF